MIKMHRLVPLMLVVMVSATLACTDKPEGAPAKEPAKPASASDASAAPPSKKVARPPMVEPSDDWRCEDATSRPVAMATTGKQILVHQTGQLCAGCSNDDTCFVRLIEQTWDGKHSAVHDIVGPKDHTSVATSASLRKLRGERWRAKEKGLAKHFVFDTKAFVIVDGTDAGGVVDRTWSLPGGGRLMFKIGKMAETADFPPYTLTLERGGETRELDRGEFNGANRVHLILPSVYWVDKHQLLVRCYASSSGCTADVLGK